MRSPSLSAELIAEFLGTLVLMLFGLGVVAMVVLFGKGIPGEIVNGGYTNINFGWGLGVMMGIFIAGRISGAHLNPAVTLALAVFRGFPWAKVAPYMIAQFAAAFLAAAVIYQNYKPAFARFDPTFDKGAAVFTTFPAFPEIWMAGMFDQVLGTAMLVLMVFAITDEKNQPAGNLTPVLVGAIVVAAGMCFGGMHGYAINPARDFGPRLFAAVAGFKNNGLSDGSGIFLVPLVGPMIGGLLGAAVYEWGIRKNLPE